MSVIKTSLPTADLDVKWDSGEAIKRVKDWSSDDNGVDFDKYQKAFFYVDGDGSKQGDYKLPFADVIDDKLTAIWAGVAAAMGAINGAQGGVDMSDDDKSAVYDQICVYYKKFDKEPPELKKSLTREVGERVDALFNFEPDSVKDLGDGKFSAVVTTSDVDRTGESIVTGGITYDNYMQNPVVLYGHDYQSLPIGKCTKLTAYKNKIICEFQLAVNEYPFAKTVSDLIKGGYLGAVSIGGVVRQWSGDYTQILVMEMVEFSVVPVPANQNALITGRSLERVTGKTLGQIQKEYYDFVQKSVADKVKRLDSTELNQHIATLEKLLGILKASEADNVLSESDQESEVIRLTIRKASAEVAKTGEQIIRLVKAKGKDNV